MDEAERLIQLLDLIPHPEGGHYRQTFRDESGGGTRGHSTLIYFLLKAGETSHWHRIDAAEVWHHYRGAPVELKIDGAAMVLGRKAGDTDHLPNYEDEDDEGAPPAAPATPAPAVPGTGQQ